MSIFHSVSRPDGSLHKVDFSSLPFVPEEVFFITGVPKGSTRGKHAHKECEQLLVLLSGEVNVRAAKRDGLWTSQLLREPGDSFFLAAQTWGEQDFSRDNSTLIVFSSMRYDETDYIRDADDFFKSTNS